MSTTEDESFRTIELITYSLFYVERREKKRNATASQTYIIATSVCNSIQS